MRQLEVLHLSGDIPHCRPSPSPLHEVDHYIRDQRVATIVNTLSHSTSQDTPTSNPPNPRHPTAYQFAIPRAIAGHHLAIANEPDTDHPPPLIPDSDTEDEADTADADNVPPLIRPDADRQPNIAPAIDLSIAQQPARPLPDDNRNNLRRNYMFGISHPLCRAAHRYLQVFDIRTANNDSDSTPIDPDDSDDSDDNHPGYWPDRRASSPPLRNSPSPQRYPTHNSPIGYNPNLTCRTHLTHSAHRPPSTAYTLPSVLVGSSARHTRPARRKRPHFSLLQE